MGKLYWIGPRESDISGLSSLFSGSFTIFGSNQDGNHAYCAQNSVRINHNVDHPDSSRFILQKQLTQIEREPDCRFMTYNPNYMVNVPDSISERMLCLNPASLLQQLNDKQTFHALFAQTVPLMETRSVRGADCSCAFLSSLGLWTDDQSFVLQETISSGGQGTFHLTKENEAEILSFLNPDEVYLVSGYLAHNIPLNLHAVLYDETILLFPGSVQVIVPEEGRLLYRGADFPAYRTVPDSVRGAFENAALTLCQKIRDMGYRGVLGLDALWTSRGVRILEVNNRFQGSTHLLNRSLLDAGLPSVQACTLDSFHHREPDPETVQQIGALLVPYSSFTQISHTGSPHVQHFLRHLLQERRTTEVLLDGYDPIQKTEDGAPLYTAVFRTNITDLCDRDLSVRLHPNLPAPSADWDRQIRSGSLTAIKIGLLNQGVQISSDAASYIERHGAMRSGTYFSLDLFLEGAYCNAPLFTKFVPFSPYSLRLNSSGTGLTLWYYETELAPADYDRQTGLYETLPFHQQICFFATDRLRLQNSNYCTFPRHGAGCRFCELTDRVLSFTRVDILSAIDACFALQPRPFRHILIGGASREPGREHDVILDICRRIRSHDAGIPIYLMCLPPPQS